MKKQDNPFLNQIILGDSLALLPQMPAKSVDLVFADPPYYLQLKQDLYRPNMSYVDGVDDDWDKFDDFADYDQFTKSWLSEVRRVMKPNASIWVSGTYHNIFRVGAVMQDLGFWILNTVTWMKFNAMPNFRGTRLKNDVEFIIWAKLSQSSKYTFHHHFMKRFNDFSPNKQLGSVWKINSIDRGERLRDKQGEKLHPTQKPVELLQRIILASSKPNEVVLDPFAGTGTTPAVAKQLRRQYIAIEEHQPYHDAALERLAEIEPFPETHDWIRAVYQEKPPRVAFKTLIADGHLQVGQTLYLDNPAAEVTITKSGKLKLGERVESIHRLACILKELPSTNGWKHWYFEAEDGNRKPIDELRSSYAENGLSAG
jgi:modification methylase